MVTQEEKDEIIALAVEKTLLSIPDVIGNLITNHAALHKLNSEFYKAHPEFAGRKDIVQSVVEVIEGKNPFMKYDEILEKAVPEIKRRMIATQDVNVIDIPKDIQRDFSKLNTSTNGVI